MEQKELLSHVDHTLLAVEATWEQIQTVCDDGMRYGVASVCIPAAFVRRAKAYVGDRVRICTVVGFPNGYSTAETKAYEAFDAVQNGADEVDMVIHVGALKEGRDDTIEEEIRLVKKHCDGKILKVIIETCLLTEDEKIRMCGIVSRAGADYIKTSTGFSKGGATREDVVLMKAHVSPKVKIKAAGGISSLQDAEDFLALGADRLGTSRIIKLIKSSN